MGNQLNVVRDSNVFPEFLSSVVQSVTTRLQPYAAPNSRLADEKIIFNECYGADNPAYTWPADSHRLDFIEIPDCTKPTLIAAVDSSCITVGETNKGIVYACRASVVFASNKRILTYIRSGPLVFYFVNDHCQGIVAPARMMGFATHHSKIGESLIRQQIERILHLELVKSLSNSVIFADGTFANHTSSLEFSLDNMCRVARIKGNALLGLSKASRLKFLLPLASGLAKLSGKMVAVETTDFLETARLNSAGRSFIVKFTDDPNVFRCDYAGTNLQEALSVVSSVGHNDNFFRGYPESLRLAHHLSVFNHADISSVRSYLCKTYSLQRLLSQDLRKIVLGRI